MKTTPFFAWSIALLLLASASLTHAADKVRVVLNSKIEAAKGKLRDQNSTEWMTEPDLKKNNAAEQAKGKQIIYFEYHLGKDKWRAIYTDKVKFAGFSWWVYYGQNEMEAKVNEEMAKGLEPAFIGRSGNGYAMLFVRPDQLADARKILEEYGVGAPKLKK